MWNVGLSGRDDRSSGQGNDRRNPVGLVGCRNPENGELYNNQRTPGDISRGRNNDSVYHDEVQTKHHISGDIITITQGNASSATFQNLPPIPLTISPAQNSREAFSISQG